MDTQDFLSGSAGVAGSSPSIDINGGLLVNDFAGSWVDISVFGGMYNGDVVMV